MISANLTAIGSRLQRAASRRQWAEVERLAAEAGAAAAAAVRARAAGDPGRAEIAAWLQELYRSSEILARIGRAAVAGELRRAIVSRRYAPVPAHPQPRVKMTL